MANEISADSCEAQMEDQADLSDIEDAENLDLSPFPIDWLNLDFVGCEQALGICGLPGCRFKETWRSLHHDIACLKTERVEDVFCLCTKGEFYWYRTQPILEQYAEAGLTVHHYPIGDGQVPLFEDLMQMVEELRVCLMAGKKTIIHCFGGLGRSVVVAVCLMMVLDDTLSAEEAIKHVKEVKGNAAIQSVKQYNLVNDFRDLLNKFKQEHKGGESRLIRRSALFV